jgi:RNA polymerase sigma-70 factor (ECF subfamily)
MAARDAISRDEWVLAVLDRHEAALLRDARRLAGDDASARDAVQHAFLKLCEEAPGELAGREAAWLFCVCRNKVVDQMRDQERLALLDGQATRQQSPLPGPAEICEAGDLHQRLQALVDRLPPAQRETLDLWCEGFRYQEIARVTGHSLGNVRVLLHRALKQLREHPAVRELLFERPEERPAASLQVESR